MAGRAMAGREVACRGMQAIFAAAPLAAVFYWRLIACKAEGGWLAAVGQALILTGGGIYWGSGTG